MEICHRDLKLENTLLTNDAAPRVKICDFGYSKNGLLDSQPKTTVGTPAYIAPEVLQKKKYDGKLADVWSCGVRKLLRRPGMQKALLLGTVPSSYVA